MISQPHNELERIATTEDLHISPFREGSAMEDTPKWIWSVAVEGGVDDRIDDAYRIKYRGSAYLALTVSERARSATVWGAPREASS